MDLVAARDLAELAVAARAHLGTEDEDVWRRQLLAHADDIAPAVGALIGGGDHDTALTMVGALGVFWQENGLVEHGRQIATRALDAAPDEITSPYARAQLVLGELAFRQGDQETAAAATGAARSIADKVDDAWVGARAEINLARVAFRDGDAPAIIDHAQRALGLASDDVRIRAAGAHMLGWGQYTAGNLDEAVTLFEENAATYRGAGDRLGEASELANIADLCAEQGDYERAAAYLRRSLEVPGLRDNKYLGPALVRSAGVLAAMRGQHEQALELIGAADAFYDRFGLVADPGDDVPHDVMHATVEAVGRDRADALCANGALWSLSDALDAAARTL